MVTGCDVIYPPAGTSEERHRGDRGLRGEAVVAVARCVSSLAMRCRENPLLGRFSDLGLPWFRGRGGLPENVLQGRWVLAVAGTERLRRRRLLRGCWRRQAEIPAPGGVPQNFGVFSGSPIRLSS